MFGRFDTKDACVGRTDRQTNRRTEDGRTELPWYIRATALPAALN